MTESLKNLPKQKEEFSKELEHLHNCLIGDLLCYAKYQTETDPDEKAESYEMLMDEENGIPFTINKINDMQTRIEVLQNEIAEYYNELVDFYGIEYYEEEVTSEYKPTPCRRVDLFKYCLQSISHEVKLVNDILNHYILNNLPTDQEEVDEKPAQRNITDEQEEEFRERYKRLSEDENYLKSLFICNLYNFTTCQMEEEPSEHDRELVRKYSEDTLVLISEMTDDLEFLEKFIEEYGEDLKSIEGYDLNGIQRLFAQYRRTLTATGDLTECYVLDELGDW